MMTLRCVALLLAAILCCCPPPAQGQQQTYSFGVVPQFEPLTMQRTWEPILNEVSRRAGVSLQLEARPSIPEFEKGFSAGAFDFAYMNPYHYIVASRQQGYLPLLRDVGRELSGIIVVQRQSPLQQVEELDGKAVAFPSPNALGAALLPRAIFKSRLGIDVHPRYVKSHTSAYLNAALNQTDAAGGVLATLRKQSPELQDALRILWKTEGIAPHPVAAHPRVPQEVRQRVQQAFLELGNDAAGRDLLAKVPFRKIGPATPEDYAPLRSMGLEDFYVSE